MLRPPPKTGFRLQTGLVALHSHRHTSCSQQPVKMNIRYRGAKRRLRVDSRGEEGAGRGRSPSDTQFLMPIYIFCTPIFTDHRIVNFIHLFISLLKCKFSIFFFIGQQPKSKCILRYIDVYIKTANQSIFLQIFKSFFFFFFSFYASAWLLQSNRAWKKVRATQTRKRRLSDDFCRKRCTETVRMCREINKILIFLFFFFVYFLWSERRRRLVSARPRMGVGARLCGSRPNIKQKKDKENCLQTLFFFP